jgi:hypothetical protein
MSSRKKIPAVKSVTRQSKNPEHELLSDTSSDESNDKPFSAAKANKKKLTVMVPLHQKRNKKLSQIFQRKQIILLY